MLLAKVGDVVPGVCVCVPTPPGPFPATGVVMTGTPLMTHAGMPIAMVGLSIIMFPCGPSVITAGAMNFNIGGMMAGRLGSPVTGCGIGTLIGSSTLTSM